MRGRIHSIETCGTVDGPGIRFVVFLQGCPLRCIYCHNPDTWNLAGGNWVEAEALIEEMKGYMPYMQLSCGGVTLSGGEPLLQPDFVLDFFSRCKKLGIHTALDTAGSVLPRNLEQILEVTDLVLLDIKHIDEEKHKEITGNSNRNALRLAKILAETSKPVWVRHVLVPGVTTDELALERLGRFIRSLGNVQKIDVLPFHKLGEHKWDALGLKNGLRTTQPPSAEAVVRAYEILAHL